MIIDLERVLFQEKAKGFVASLDLYIEDLEFNGEIFLLIDEKFSIEKISIESNVIEEINVEITKYENKEEKEIRDEIEEELKKMLGPEVIQEKIEELKENLVDTFNSKSLETEFYNDPKYFMFSKKNYDEIITYFQIDEKRNENSHLVSYIYGITYVIEFYKEGKEHKMIKEYIEKNEKLRFKLLI